MNILVTGATGFIGSHLCRELLNKGYHVYALSHSGRTDKVQSLLPENEFHLLTGDILDADMIRNLINDNNIEVAFHLAARLPDGDSDDDLLPFLDTNIKGTLNILQAACECAVNCIVYVSTMSVYSEPPHYLPVDEDHPTCPSSAYGVTKLAGELLCNLYSKAMSVIVLRYAGVYGQHQYKHDAVATFIDRALHNNPITIHGNGKQTSDFVYIDDVVQSTLLAWRRTNPEFTTSVLAKRRVSRIWLERLSI